jgi:carboxyl-terminal processing protease
MKGENTKIEVKYLSRGKNTAQIILDEVEKNRLFFSKIDAKTGYIGWLILIKASYETKQALEELKRQGAERIILDLRGNPRLAQ